MLTAGDLMTRDLFILSPTMSVTDAAKALVARGVSAAPVCSSDGKLVGMLSKSDIVDAYFSVEPCSRSDAIADIMSLEVITARIGEPIEQVRERMIFEGVHRVVVIDSDEVVGILSAVDVLRGKSVKRKNTDAMAP